MKKFAFGMNWQRYLETYFTIEALDEAKHSLLKFMGMETLAGQHFLDVGCGSGLFSLAAHELGAEKVISFDIDPDSVDCCLKLWEHKGKPDNWTIMKGSALDEYFMQALEKTSIVYSWGVLHHTGDMWRAIHNASHCVRPNGLFYLAIYNRADGIAIYPDGRMGASTFWKIEKRLYSTLPAFLQECVVYFVMALMCIGYLITFNNPIRKIRQHRKLRGMSWRIDIRDWIGGYPYEFASADEVFLFMKSRGFGLENMKCNNGLLNNEFLFRKRPANKKFRPEI